MASSRGLWSLEPVPGIMGHKIRNTISGIVGYNSSIKLCAHVYRLGQGSFSHPQGGMQQCHPFSYHGPQFII